MKCVAVLPVVVILIVASGNAGKCVREVGSCENPLPPLYVSLECRILVPGSECYIADAPNGHSGITVRVHACDHSLPCQVWTGMALNISCSDENLILFHGNSTDNTSSSYWSFAVSSAVQGVYECRWPNNSVCAYRNVTVDERVYVMPYCEDCSLYDTNCRTNIAPIYTPGFNCTVAYTPERHESEEFKVWFNILGARPINLSMEVVWVNHYPLDLQLSYQSTAKSSTMLHSAMLNAAYLVFVGNATFVYAFLVITAERISESFTMCVPMEFSGDPVLFPNEKLPKQVTVAAGQNADFYCDALTKVSTDGLAVSSFTVAFHILAPPMPGPVQCLNCTFSNHDLRNCRKNMDKGPCSGIQFSNTSSGNPNLLNHSLRAQWRQVQADKTGWKMVCAIAANGVIQWAHTATLTVTPTTPTPESEGVIELALGAGSGAVLVMVCVGVAIISLVIWLRRRHRNNSTPEEEEEVPLAAPPSPSSSVASPTSEGYMLQLFSPSGVEQNGNVSRGRQSMDSGLDVNTTVEIELARASTDGQLLSAYKHQSLTDLPSSSAEVCVYVSYSDSQSEWVRDQLLPLLHTFRPITVTDHETHMIAGNVTSEERLRLLSSADKVIAVVTPDYHRVDWCSYEMQHAIQRSPGGEGRLIPILCGGCTQLPSTISTLHPIAVWDPNWPHKLKVAIHSPHR